MDPTAMTLTQDMGGAAPLVTCVCPTFNRPSEGMELLEEAVESFLRQDYEQKELLILNDCPEQVLVCDAPGVRVVNFPSRFPSLGEKRNAGVRLARGTLIARGMTMTSAFPGGYLSRSPRSVARATTTHASTGSTTITSASSSRTRRPGTDTT